MNFKNILNGALNPTNIQRNLDSGMRKDSSMAKQSQYSQMAQKYGLPTTSTNTPLSSPEQQQFHKIYAQQQATRTPQSMTMPVQGSFTPVSQPQPIHMLSATSTPQTVQATAVAPNSTPIAAAQTQAKTTAPAKTATPTNTTYKVVSGDNLTAIAKKYGTTVDALLKLNPNIKNANSISIGQSINIGKSAGASPTSGGSKGWVPPKDYSSLQTPEQLMEYAKQQAQSKYNNEALGIQQLIDQYNLQMGQLATDAAIQAEAKRMTDLKYADALTGIDTSRNDAQSQYQGNLQNLQNQYNQGTGELHNNAFQQRQRSLEEMYARGLGMSTVLDQRTGMIDKSEQDGITKLTSDLNNNVANLDRDISTLMTNLDLQKNSLTKQQQTELVGMIQDKMKERNDEKAKLQQLITQQTQNKNQAKSNMTAYEQQLFQELFGKNADLWRDDRDFNEDKRRWELEYALKKQAGSGGGGGSRYRNPGGSNGGNNPKSSTTSGGTYSRSAADKAAAASGQSTPSERLAAGQGPISDAYYKKPSLPDYVPVKSNPQKSRDDLLKNVFKWK